MILKKLLSLTLIFSLIAASPIALAANSINCSSPKDDAEKNYCLTKEREEANKADTVGKLGQNGLESLTVMLAAISAITVKVNSADETKGKQCPVYYGRRLEPLLVAAGGALLIFAEMESFITFKRDCSDLLNSKGAALATKIADIDKKAGPDPILSGSCIAENLKVEGQISDYCRAKACTLRMKYSAEKKIKHLGWAKSAYMAATTIELTNIIVNLAKYALCQIPYMKETCAGWQPDSDCLNYVMGKDAKVKQTVKTSVRNRNKNNFEMNIVDTLNFNLNQEKYNNLLISQLNHSANYIETLILLDDFQRITEGELSSTSIDKYEFMKTLNLNSIDKTNNLKSVVQMAYELTRQLSPIQNANAKFDAEEILATVGLGSGISLPLLGKTKDGVDKLITTTWKYPLGRVIYFGALFGLVYANQSVYKNRIVGDLDNRAKTFDDKLTELTAPSIPAINMPDITTPAIDMPTIPEVPKVKVPKTATPEPGSCITDDMSVDKTCECLKTNKCNEMVIPEVQVPKDQPLPASLTSTMRDLKNLTNAYSRGDMAKADMASNSLNAGFAALAGDHNKLKKKFKEAQINAKQTPTDVDKEIKKFQGELLKTVAEGLGVPAPNSSAASSSSSGGGDSAKKADDKESPTQTINTSNASGGAATSGTATAAKTDDLGLGLDELGATELGKLEEEGKVAGLDAYDFKTEDISKKSDEDIFKNISSRYLKTAYPILLKELKTEPVNKEK